MERPGDINAVLESLRRVRARARALLLTQRALLLLGAMLAALLVLGAADYALRFPAWIRSWHLVLGAAAFGFALWRYIGRAVAFNPSLTTIALRVEQRRPALRGRLASAVDFISEGDASSADHDPRRMGAALARSVVLHTGADWRADAVADALHPTRALRAAGAFVAVLLLTFTTLLLSPNLAAIGAARALAPWAGVEWPKRTGVVDVTRVEVHPRGAALALRAAVVKSNRDMESTYVAAQHRVITRDGRAGPVRTDLLTYQRRAVEVPEDARTRDRPDAGALFERLIDADAHAVEYRLRTTDDETPWRRIRIVDPPRVERAHAVITPPEYARRLETDAASPTISAPTDLDMGSGADERALAPPALAGSRVELTLTLNKPVPLPADPASDNEWLQRTLSVDALGPDPEFDLRPDAWTLRWTLDRSVRLPVALVDEHGIESVDEAVFRFEAAQDRPPAATITDPPTDVSLLATAVLNVVGEGRDDVGLTRVSIHRQRATPAGEREPSGPGGALEPESDPVEIAAVETRGERAARATARIDLAVLGMRPGDELWLTARATDALASETGLRDDTVSPTRRVRIITENELIEEIRAELSGVRQAAMRADTQQAELREQTRVRGSDRQTRRSQAQVSERVARQQEAVRRLQERVDANALNDERLSSLLRDAADALNEARDASERAARTLDDALADARAENTEVPDAAPLSEQQAQDAAQQQERVREELTRLVDMLDAGQDGWVMQRRLEQLLRQQAELREQARAAAAENAGVPADQLTRQQRSEMERIAERQQELADEARRLREELARRADDVRENDPAAAAGMRQAAQRAEQEGLAQDMEQAAQQAQSNQMNEAGRSQESAMQTMRDMLEEFERGERSRQEELRRILASVIESLETLISRQTAEIARLDDAAGRNAPLAPLDEGMIALNRNTLAVLDLVRNSGRELAPVARLVSRAATAQTEAIGALRRPEPNAPDVRAHEQESLDLLTEAKREAERIEREQQAIEQARRQAELRREYTRILTKQLALREATAPFAQAAELTRRDRASVRALGEEQVAVREELAALLNRTRELAEARIFEFTHTRLDDATGRAADALRAGEPAPAVPEQERAIAALRAILDALAAASPGDENNFDSGAGSGSGSGSGGGEQPLIPPIAELKLLRDMQAMIYAETRALGDAGALAPSEHVRRIGRDQRALHDIGADLIDALRRGGRPGEDPPILVNPDEDPPPNDPAPEPPEGDDQ